MVKVWNGWELGFRRGALEFISKINPRCWNVKIWEVNSLIKGKSLFTHLRYHSKTCSCFIFTCPFFLALEYKNKVAIKITEGNLKGKIRRLREQHPFTIFH